MKPQCCCGRLDGSETVIINGIQHERFGPTGAMCAPVQACELRDVRREVERLEKENQRLRGDLKDLGREISRIYEDLGECE